MRARWHGRRSGFLRSDSLGAGAAVAYVGRSVDSLRTNQLHLPVRGNGDGGMYSTAADLSSFWPAFFDGRIVSKEWAATMAEPRSDVPSERKRYGLGFWLARAGPAVLLEGFDAGVSFRSAHDPVRGSGYTVLSNMSWGAWPLVQLLDAEVLGLSVV